MTPSDAPYEEPFLPSSAPAHSSSTCREIPDDPREQEQQEDRIASASRAYLKRHLDNEAELLGRPVRAGEDPSKATKLGMQVPETRSIKAEKQEEGSVPFSACNTRTTVTNQDMVEPEVKTEVSSEKDNKSSEKGR